MITKAIGLGPLAKSTNKKRNGKNLSFLFLLSLNIHKIALIRH